jgi:hypothetical protein
VPVTFLIAIWRHLVTWLRARRTWTVNWSIVTFIGSDCYALAGVQLLATDRQGCVLLLRTPEHQNTQPEYERPLVELLRLLGPPQISPGLSLIGRFLHSGFCCSPVSRASLDRLARRDLSVGQRTMLASEGVLDRPTIRVTVRNGVNPMSLSGSVRGQHVLYLGPSKTPGEANVPGTHISTPDES